MDCDVNMCPAGQINKKRCIPCMCKKEPPMLVLCKNCGILVENKHQCDKNLTLKDIK
jgi:hypothetical protein